MKNIIILALCLVVVCSCSEENSTNTEIIDKDTIDSRIVFIEGMVIDNDGFGNLDTLGDPDRIDEFCIETDIDFLDARPYIIYGVFDFSYRIWEAQNVELSIETINTSQKIKDDVLSRYNRAYPDHSVYFDSTLYKSYLKPGNYSYRIFPYDMTLGAYLLKVKREGTENLCKPIIITARNIE